MSLAAAPSLRSPPPAMLVWRSARSESIATHESHAPPATRPRAPAPRSTAQRLLRPPMPVPTPLTFAPNAALLIDFDNVTMGIRSDLQTELKTLLASDIIKGKVQLRRAYADWRRYPQYVAPLAESSIDMIMAPAYGSSKKNATDIRLAIDALELVFTRPEIGTYILLSGDSDFSTLVIKLKEYGKYVIGVGIRESSSDLLVMNCDEYYSYNALAGLVRSSAEDEASGGVAARSVGARERGDRPHGAERRRHARRSLEAGHAGHRQHVRREEPRHVQVLSLRTGSGAARADLALEDGQRAARSRTRAAGAGCSGECARRRRPPASASDDRARAATDREAKAHGERAEEARPA